MNFDVTRLRRADRIVGVSAIAFLIVLFGFKWFGFSSNIHYLGGDSLNGWHSFTNSRWIWLITILAGLGSIALVGMNRTLRGPLQPGVIVAGLGALSVLLILYRIVHHPAASASIGALHFSWGIKLGIWLGLIAAAALTYGAYRQMRAEGTSLSDVRGQAERALSGLTTPAPPTPAPERTPGASASPHDPPPAPPDVPAPGDDAA
jgi:hypothetical protein